MLAALDALWNTQEPYILTVHQAPVADSDTSDYRCFIRIIPLVRTPGLQKFRAGLKPAPVSSWMMALPNRKHWNCTKPRNVVRGTCEPPQWMRLPAN